MEFPALDGLARLNLQDVCNLPGWYAGDGDDDGDDRGNVISAGRLVRQGICVEIIAGSSDHGTEVCWTASQPKLYSSVHPKRFLAKVFSLDISIEAGVTSIGKEIISLCSILQTVKKLALKQKAEVRSLCCSVRNKGVQTRPARLQQSQEVNASAMLCLYKKGRKS